MFGRTTVYGHAQIHGDAWVDSNCSINTYANIYGNARIKGEGRIFGYAQVCREINEPSPFRITEPTEDREWIKSVYKKQPGELHAF